MLGTFELVWLMQALKNAKQLVNISHIKTRSIVPHEHHYFIVVSIGAPDLDFGPRPYARELDGVGQKVDDYEPQQGTVSVTNRKTADFPDYIAAVG